MANSVAQFVADPGNVVKEYVRNGQTVTVGNGVIRTATGLIPVSDGSAVDGIAHDTVTGTATIANSYCDVFIGKWFRFTPAGGYTPTKGDPIVPASATTFDGGTPGDISYAKVIDATLDSNGQALAEFCPAGGSHAVPVVI